MSKNDLLVGIMVGRRGRSRSNRLVDEQETSRQRDVLKSKASAILLREHSLQLAQYEDIFEEQLEENPELFDDVDLWCFLLANRLKAEPFKALPDIVTSPAVSRAALPRLSFWSPWVTKTPVFDVTPDKLYRVCVEVCLLNKYPIIASRPSSLILCFSAKRKKRTRVWQDMTMMLVPISETSTKIKFGGSERQSMFARPLKREKIAEIFSDQLTRMLQSGKSDLGGAHNGTPAAVKSLKSDKAHSSVETDHHQDSRVEEAARLLGQTVRKILHIFGK